MANAVSVILRPRKNARPSAANLVHNSGLKSASYWLEKNPQLYQSFRPQDIREANEIWRNWIKEIEENYQRKRGRKLRNDAIRIEEGLLVVGKDVQGREDPAMVWEFARSFLTAFEQRYGGKVLHVAVHNHEGQSKEEPNIHVHFLYSNFDDEGRNVRSKKITKAELTLIQSAAYNVAKHFFPGVERATNYAKQGRKAPRQKHHREFRKEKEKEAAEERAAKQTIAKARVSDLKAEIASLREELQREKAKRPQYAAMEQAAREMKEQIRARDLTIRQLHERTEMLRSQLLMQIEAAKAAKAAEERAKKEKEAAEKRAAELAEKVEWQSIQLDNWAGRAIELEDQVDEAQKRATNAEKRAEKAETRVNAAEAKITRLESQQRQEAPDIEELEEKIVEQQRIIDRLVSYIDHWGKKLGVTVAKGATAAKIVATIDRRIEGLLRLEALRRGSRSKPKIDDEPGRGGRGRGPGM